MPKIKTVKAVAKRVKTTKKGKVITKKAGKGHFNARETGKTTRKKRRTNMIADPVKKNIKKFIPYNF